MLNHSDLLEYFDQRSKPFWLVVGVALILLLGILDYQTGFEISFGVFYLAPVSLVAWFIGRKAAVVASVMSAAVWLLSNWLAGERHAEIFIYYWNAATRLGFFLTVALLLPKLRKELGRERALARTDPLTGAANARAFHEMAEIEIERARRYARPFTVAYLDLDNFKAVNDRLGHSTGDALLRAVVETIKHNLRVTDIVARLGGDEFAILLPEAGPDPAQTATRKIQKKLLDEMEKNQWPVTFSIGVLTCLAPPHTVDEMIKLADNLMYTVKNNGKNRVKHEVLVAQLMTTDIRFRHGLRGA